MRGSTILYVLGWPVMALAVLCLLPVVFSINAQEWDAAGIFAISALIYAFLGGLLIAGFRGRPGVYDRSNTIGILILGWVMLPLLASIPFVGSAQFASPAEAIFEAVSGLTTTGATVLSVPQDASTGVLVWRAVLQWSGGAFTLLTALIVLGPLHISGTPANMTIPGYERRDLVHSVVSASRHIMPVYAGLTLLCLVLLWLAGIPAFDAFCLSLSTLSTGGFMVRSGGLVGYNSVLAEAVIAVFMLVGAVSILALWHFLRKRGRDRPDSQETVRLLVISLCGALVIGALAFDPVSSDNWSAAASAIRTGLFRAISLVTTTGFDNARDGTSAVPFVIVLLLCLIGGAAYSTAGGLKQYRFLILMSQAQRELYRLLHPHIVIPNRVAGHVVDLEIMRSIWALLAVLISATCCTMFVLSVQGFDFERALLSSIAAITNNGPAVGMATVKVAAWSGYGGVSGGSLITLSIAMILGRLELLVVLSVVQVNFWRK